MDPGGAQDEPATLEAIVPAFTSIAVDQALGEILSGLNIAPNKANDLLFKHAIYATNNMPFLYACSTTTKLSNEIHNDIYSKYHAHQNDCLEQMTRLMGAITSDTAMFFGNKLTNFFCFNCTKGMMFLLLINCDKMLPDGAKVDALFIATNL